MIQCPHRSRLALEASHAIRVSGKGLGQDFDGDDAIQTSIAGAINLTHPTCPNGREDFIGAQTLTGLAGHGPPAKVNWQSITRSSHFRGTIRPVQAHTYTHSEDRCDRSFFLQSPTKDQVLAHPARLAMQKSKIREPICLLFSL
jgi:hypothetical protein